MTAASRSSLGICRNAWRIRKIPKPVAKNGTVSPRKLPSQLRSTTVVAFTVAVISKGIMIVPSTTKNSVRRSGKRKKTKA